MIHFIAPSQGKLLPRHFCFTLLFESSTIGLASANHAGKESKIPPGSEAEKFFWNSSLRIAELIILDKSRDMHYIPED
jgi:hypothetical protein